MAIGSGCQWLPPPITVPAVADPVFYCLFMYANGMQMSGGKKATTGMAICPCRLPFRRWPELKLSLPRLEKKHGGGRASST